MRLNPAQHSPEYSIQGRQLHLFRIESSRRKRLFSATIFLVPRILDSKTESFSRNRSTRFDIIHATEGPHRLGGGLGCGKIAVIFGRSSARTIGFTFGRIYFSGTEFHLPRQTPSPLAPLSIADSGPDAMSAAKSIPISPQTC